MGTRWPNWQQKQATFQRVNYAPHSAQVPIHQSDARVIVVAGAERAGKSLFAGNEVTARTPWCERIGFAAQDYFKARPEWKYTVEALESLGAMANTSAPRQGQWFGQTRTGCELKTISLERGVDQLTGTGESFDIVVLCEWGLMNYNAFLAARGRVAEPRGMVLAIGTLLDTIGWQADLYRLGQGPNALGVESFSLPAWANLALFPGGKEDPEIIAWRGALADTAEAARRIDALVLPSPARMFPEFSNIIHVVPWAEFDPEDSVYLAVDAGYYPSRYALLAVQFRKDNLGREIGVIIDEVWEHNLFHENAVAIARARPWAVNVVQAIGGHETKQHPAAKSTAELWAELWPGLYFETFDAGRILEGAARIRWLMRYDQTPPRLYLSPRCTGTAWEFGHYKRRTDRQGNVLSEDPQDKNNDALDALRNLVVWRYGVLDEVEEVERDWQQTNDWGNPYG
jgi:hypothetical protein